MAELPFHELVRRYPPRRKTCIAAVLVVCGAMGLEIYNQATASWTRVLNDSMTTWSLLAMTLTFFGLAAGFLFGRAPKLFALMVVVTLLNQCSLALWSRSQTLEPLSPAPKATK